MENELLSARPPSLMPGEELGFAPLMWRRGGGPEASPGIYEGALAESSSFSMTRAPFWIIFDVYICLLLMGNRLRMFL